MMLRPMQDAPVPVRVHMTEDGHWLVESGLIAVHCQNCPFEAFTFSCRVSSIVRRVHTACCEGIHGRRKPAEQLELSFHPFQLREGA